MKTWCISAFALLFCCQHSLAITPMPLEKVSIDHFTKETQVTLAGEEDDKVFTMAWWIPNEFWEAVLSRDATVPAAGKRAMMDAMAGIAIVGFVQADIGDRGEFNFYSRDDIRNRLQLSSTDPTNANAVQALKIVDAVKPDLQNVLSVFKPILESAMGNLGKNFHFFVVEDRSQGGRRLIDPRNEAKVFINSVTSKSKKLSGTIDFPLDCLFVPRMCKNGQPAHVTWKYCPWSGEKLSD